MRKLALIALLGLSGTLGAQEPAAPAAPGPGDVVDRVIAVVGDTSLLLSDVQEEVERLRQAGQLPTEREGQAALFRQILQQQVDRLILFQAARADKLELGEEDVARTVDREIAEIRGRFPSEEAFTTALARSGLTPDEFRRRRVEQGIVAATVEQFIRKRAGSAVPPRISDAEMQTFFEAQRTALGERPATVSFDQILVRPTPSDSAKARARRRAEEALKELRAGGDFEVLARRYSEDPGSRERGGDLGWFRQGQMVRPFEEMAFALRPGVVSPIVETQFGYHIIRVEKVRTGERQARHILVKPEVSEADVALARAAADSAAAALRAGTAPSVLQARYNTPADQRIADDVPVERLPAAYGPALEGVSTGTVVGPITLPEGPQGTEFSVLRVTERKGAGAYTLEDVRPQVRERIAEQKALEQLIDELRRTTYVNVLI